jgi:DNA-binding NtrC family response regulator
VRHVRPDVFDFLAEQPWPGNVRQLLHEVEKATIFADGAELARADFRLDDTCARSRADVIAEAVLPAPVAMAAVPAVPAEPAAPRVHDRTQKVAQAMVRAALARLGGNKRRVARELGISRSHLYRLLELESEEPVSG